MQRNIDPLLTPTLQNEESLISCIILDAEKCTSAFSQITPDMFLYSEYRDLYAAAQNRFDNGKKIDAVVLSSDTGISTQKLADICTNLEYRISHIQEYANLVQQAWQKRILKEKLLEVAEDCDFYGEDISALLAKVDTAVAFQIKIEQKKSDENAKDFRSCLVEWVADFNKPNTAISTGYHSLDRYLGGLERGSLYVLSARPGMGKTDFALNLALQIAANNHNVNFNTMEMPRTQCVARLISKVTRINSARIRDRGLEIEEQESIALATEAICKIPLIIDETPSCSISQIKTKIEKYKPALLTLDNLQLMAYAGNSKNQWENIGATMKELKQIALQSGIAILLLAQEGREADKGGKVSLSNLQGSSAIEQNADVVLFLRNEKPEYPIQGSEFIETRLFIKKNRNGVQDVTCFFEWQPHYHSYKEG